MSVIAWLVLLIGWFYLLIHVFNSNTTRNSIHYRFVSKTIKWNEYYKWYAGGCVSQDTCSRGRFGDWPVRASYIARWNGIVRPPRQSLSYISSHLEILISCISIGQPDSDAIRISDDTTCPVMECRCKRLTFWWPSLFQKTIHTEKSKKCCQVAARRLTIIALH